MWALVGWVAEWCTRLNWCFILCVVITHWCATLLATYFSLIVHTLHSVFIIFWGSFGHLYVAFGCCCVLAIMYVGMPAYQVHARLNASHLICLNLDTKQTKAWLLLSWGTTWDSRCHKHQGVLIQKLMILLLDLDTRLRNWRNGKKSVSLVVSPELIGALKNIYACILLFYYQDNS